MPCDIGQGLIDTSCSRFVVGQKNLKWERMLTTKWGLSTQKIKLEKAMTFRFGNDETLETKTMGIVGIKGALRLHVVPGRAPLLLSKELLKDLLREVGSASCGDK